MDKSAILGTTIPALKMGSQKHCLSLEYSGDKVIPEISTFIPGKSYSSFQEPAPGIKTVSKGCKFYIIFLYTLNLSLTLLCF